MLEKIFENSQVEIYRSGGEGAACVVTFSSLRERTKCFAAGLFQAEKVPGFYFIPKSDHWWQPLEILDGVAAVRNAIAAGLFRKVLTYGTSMGAYGAATYSKALGASACLLVAPQWSANPDSPPHEKRWQNEASSIIFDRDDMGNQIDEGAIKWVIYDPHNEDRFHAEKFGQVKRTELIPLPYATHSVPAFLLQTGVLKKLALSALSGELSRSGLAEWTRPVRKKSSAYWLGLSDVVAVRHRRWLSGTLARAVECNPTDVAARVRLAYALIDIGKPLDALYILNVAHDMAPKNAKVLRGLCRANLKLGRAVQAVDSIRKALVLNPKSADFHFMLGVALSADGKLSDAIRAYDNSLTISPGYLVAIDARDRLLKKI